MVLLRLTFALFQKTKRKRFSITSRVLFATEWRQKNNSKRKIKENKNKERKKRNDDEVKHVPWFYNYVITIVV